MGNDRTGPYSDRGPTQRLTVAEAAEVLGISAEAVRMRIRRGTLRSERHAGTVYAVLDVDQTRHVGDTSTDRTDALVDEMRGRIDDLREQLAAERTAHSEARRLLAAALERIPPQIEPPRESPQTPDSPGPTDTPTDDDEAPQTATSTRSWWQRWFGA